MRHANNLLNTTMRTLKKVIEALSSIFRSRFKILAYHSVAPVSRSRYEIAAEDFEKQMEYLSSAGYRVISLQDALSSMQSGCVDAKAVVITFDDGYRTLVDHAFPVLGRRGWPATVFVPVAHIGGPYESSELMSWADINEAVKKGIAFGSHTMNHRSLPELNDEDLQYELAESRRILAAELRLSFHPLAYPYGYFDRRVADAARASGYDLALTFGSILSNTSRTNPFEMKREQVLCSTTLKGFSRKVDVRWDLPRKMWHMIVPEK